MLLIEDQNLAPALLAESVEPLKTKARQPILVGEKQYPDCSSSINAKDRLRRKFILPPISSMNSTLTIPRAVQNCSKASR